MGSNFKLQGLDSDLFSNMNECPYAFIIDKNKRTDVVDVNTGEIIKESNC